MVVTGFFVAKNVQAALDQITLAVDVCHDKVLAVAPRLLEPRCQATHESTER